MQFTTVETINLSGKDMLCVILVSRTLLAICTTSVLLEMDHVLNLVLPLPLTITTTPAGKRKYTQNNGNNINPKNAEDNIMLCLIWNSWFHLHRHCPESPIIDPAYLENADTRAMNTQKILYLQKMQKKNDTPTSTAAKNDNDTASNKNTAPVATLPVPFTESTNKSVKFLYPKTQASTHHAESLAVAKLVSLETQSD